VVSAAVPYSPQQYAGLHRNVLIFWVTATIGVGTVIFSGKNDNMSNAIKPDSSLG
jgi:hypothetical protein